MKLLPDSFRHSTLSSLAFCLLLSATLGCAFSARAVTDAEMEKARIIAAKTYIRFANNASGYLDGQSFSSMSELEGSLRNDKDKESLRQFRSTSTPSDYASWDKEQLVSYWSTTFFKDNASKLNPEAANNGLAKKQIKDGVSKIQVVAQAQPEAEPQDESQTEQVAPDENKSAQDIYNDELQEVEGEINKAEQQLENDSITAEAPAAEKKSSGTWVYVMVLAILVVIVILLVAYASRTMKGEARKSRSDDDLPGADERSLQSSRTQTRTVTVIEHNNPVQDTPYEIPAPEESRSISAAAEEARLREKYARSLSEKSEEIRNLTRQLSDTEMLVSRLREDNQRLTAELERLRTSHRETHASSYEPKPSLQPQAASANSAPAATHSSPASRSNHNEVYLGRVNSRGIFVRADRTAIEGQSIYKLTTSNGVSGTFQLIHNRALDAQLLDDPGKWLAGGCFAKDIFDTGGKYTVVTETPGTAVFKDGAWRVERKAKIRYE